VGTIAERNEFQTQVDYYPVFFLGELLIYI
jgi:hypothetical protein